MPPAKRSHRHCGELTSSKELGTSRLTPAHNLVLPAVRASVHRLLPLLRLSVQPQGAQRRHSLPLC